MRLLLIGRGPLASPQGFPQLRLQHFVEALGADLEAKHELRVVELVPQSTPAQENIPGSQWSGHHWIAEEGPDWITKIKHLAHHPDGSADAIIAAGPHNPSRVACLIAEDIPVWADFPGDPFAEFHSLSVADTATAERFAGVFEATLPVLARADHFSVVSERQQWATLGQLELLGRMVQPGAEQMVSVVPVAIPPTKHESSNARPHHTGKQGLVIAISGGFNTWFDHQTLVSALEQFLPRHPDAQVQVTGGPLPGHYDKGHAAFESWATQYPEQVHLHGWASADEAELILSSAHVGICLDLPSLEPLLGSRTRVLWWADRGLDVICTPSCELLKHLARDGLVHGVPPQSPESVVAQLERLVASPQTSVGNKLQQEIRRIANPTTTAANLVAWARRPYRTASPPSETIGGHLAVENTRLRDQITRIHQSPTWRVLSALQRKLS